MNRRRNCALAGALGLLSLACASTGVPTQLAPARLLTVAWPVDNLAVIGGYQAKPSGSPTVTDDADAAGGKTVCFNGKRDALVLPVSPLAEQTGFSIQALVKILPGGGKTQSFLHIEDAMGDARVLFEMKAAPDSRWMTHTFVRNKIDLVKLEPTTAVAANEWHWIAMTFGPAEGVLRLFVDGQKTAEAKMSLSPMGTGKLSLGAHQDPKNWFKGCVKEVRFANDAVPVDQLARPPSPVVPPPSPVVPPPSPPPPAAPSSQG